MPVVSFSPFTLENISLHHTSETAQCPHEIQRILLSPYLDLLAASDSVVHPIFLKKLCYFEVWRYPFFT